MKVKNLQEKVNHERAPPTLNPRLSDYYFRCFERVYGRIDRAPPKGPEEKYPILYYICFRKFYFSNIFQNISSKIKSYVQKHIT